VEEGGGGREVGWREEGKVGGVVWERGEGGGGRGRLGRGGIEGGGVR